MRSAGSKTSRDATSGCGPSAIAWNAGYVRRSPACRPGTWSGIFVGFGHGPFDDGIPAEARRIRAPVIPRPDPPDSPLRSPGDAHPTRTDKHGPRHISRGRGGREIADGAFLPARCRTPANIPRRPGPRTSAPRNPAATACPRDPRESLVRPAPRRSFRRTRPPQAYADVPTRDFRWPENRAGPRRRHVRPEPSPPPQPVGPMRARSCS